jgi:DNA-binding NarL/FixJ family response regulator
VRVVIAEDLFLLRDGLTRLLQAYGLQVAAAVDDGPGLLAAVTEHQPDVAIVDVRLPPTFTDEGLKAALTARAQQPGLPVLVLSQYVEQLYARELLAGGTGGIGYLLKDRVLNGAQFTDAVRRVAGGGTAMDPEVIAQLLDRNSADGALATISPREREVLRLMAEGRSNAAIAQRLVITDLPQAEPAALRRRQSAGARRPRLPRPLTAGVNQSSPHLPDACSRSCPACMMCCSWPSVS